jgi:hypothetical protein
MYIVAAYIKSEEEKNLGDISFVQHKVDDQGSLMK